MAKSRSPSAKFILRGQAFGFGFLLTLMWTAELLHLPHYLFGDSTESMWPRLTLRTVVLVGIWLIVHLSTSRLLRRLHELETYLRICSWCRKVDNQGEWRSMEDYFDTRFHTNTSHGICPACAQAQFAKQFTITREKSGRKS